MGANSDILYAIREMSKGDNVYSLPCEVISVDTSSYTCDVTPLDNSPDILDVKLVVNNNGFVLIPKVGSTVIVSFIGPDNGFVAMCSEIDDVVFKVTNTIKINGDNFDGMVKIGDLVTKLNNLENAYNDLVIKFNTHIHVAVDSITTAPITVSPTVSQETTILTPTLQAELENTSVKHGQ